MSIEQIKRQAKRLSKILPEYDFSRTPLSLSMSQDIVARQYGFENFFEANNKQKVQTSPLQAPHRPDPDSVNLCDIEREGVLCCEDFALFDFKSNGPLSSKPFRFMSAADLESFDHPLMSLYVIRHSLNKATLVVCTKDPSIPDTNWIGLFMNFDQYRAHFCERAVRAVTQSPAYAKAFYEGGQSRPHGGLALEITMLCIPYGSSGNPFMDASIFPIKRIESFPHAIHWSTPSAERNNGFENAAQYKDVFVNMLKSLRAGKKVNVLAMMLLLHLQAEVSFCEQAQARVDSRLGKNSGQDDGLSFSYRPAMRAARYEFLNPEKLTKALSICKKAFPLLNQADPINMGISYSMRPDPWVDTFVRAYSEFHPELKEKPFAFVDGKLKLSFDLVNRIGQDRIEIKMPASVNSLTSIMPSRAKKHYRWLEGDVIAFVSPFVSNAQALIDAMAKTCDAEGLTFMAFCRHANTWITESNQGQALRRSIITPSLLLDSSEADVAKRCEYFTDRLNDNVGAFVVIEDAGHLRKLGLLDGLIYTAKEALCTVLLLESETSMFFDFLKDDRISVCALGVSDETLKDCEKVCQELNLPRLSQYKPKLKKSLGSPKGSFLFVKSRSDEGVDLVVPI